MAALHSAFGAQTGNWTPAPGGVVVHSAALAYKVLHNGDHIVVMMSGGMKGHVHHGIVIGNANEPGGMMVAEMASPTHDKKLRDGRLQVTPFEKFLAGYNSFGIVPYAPADNTAEDQHRAVAVNRAQALVAAPPTELANYKLIHWNCESFAWMCKTGNVSAKSADVGHVLATIRNDLIRNEKAFKLQTTPKAARKCVIS